MLLLKSWLADYTSAPLRVVTTIWPDANSREA